jgi:hypothetical protein
MDGRPPILPAECGTCHRARESGYWELLLLAPPTTGLVFPPFGQSPNQSGEASGTDYLHFLLRSGHAALQERTPSGDPRFAQPFGGSFGHPQVEQREPCEALGERRLPRTPRPTLVVCYAGAANTQSIDHYYGPLHPGSHENLTADGVSSGHPAAVLLRLLGSMLSMPRTQPRRARISGAVFLPDLWVGWGSVPRLAWGCNAASDSIRTRLPCTSIPALPATRHRPPFDHLPRMLVWPSPQAFLEWPPETPRVECPSISSTHLPITSQRGRGGIRMSIR